MIIPMFMTRDGLIDLIFGIILLLFFIIYTIFGPEDR